MEIRRGKLRAIKELLEYWNEKPSRITSLHLIQEDLEGEPINNWNQRYSSGYGIAIIRFRLKGHKKFKQDSEKEIIYREK